MTPLQNFMNGGILLPVSTMFHATGCVRNDFEVGPSVVQMGKAPTLFSNEPYALAHTCESVRGPGATWMPAAISFEA